MSGTEEFDHIFFSSNPGLVLTHRYFDKNRDAIVGLMKLELRGVKDVPFEQKAHVNMAHNCKP
jgi:hypothetical protein